MAIAVALTANNANAAIMLVDSVGFTSASGSTEDSDADAATHTVPAGDLGGFNPNGADKLVVVIGNEGLNNGALSNDVTGVTYGGVAMTMAVERFGNGNRGGEIWYLDNVGVTGDFVITYAGSSGGLGFGAYALNNAAPGVAQTASTTATSGSEANIADMTMTALEGDFVVAGFARNNTDTGGGIGVAAPLTQLFYGDTDGSSAASGYQIVAADGPVTPDIQRLSNNVGALFAARFEAVAIPEPSSLVILGLGVLLLARRCRS